MKSNTKDWIQYSTAIMLAGSGVGLAFLSFFLNEYNIAEGVLFYIAQAFVFAGGIFGVSVYIRTKISEFKSEVVSEVKRKIDRLESEADCSDPHSGKKPFQGLPVDDTV